MAEAAKKESTEVAESKAGEKATEKKADFLGIALVVLVGANLLILLSLGYFVKKMWGRVQNLQTMIEKPAESQESEGQSLGKELQPQNVGVLYPLDSFLVNITSDQGAKYLQVQMELELGDPAVEEELSRKKAAIRDSVIVLLSSKNYKQLREPNGIKALRTDLLRTINHNLATGQVKDVFFTQFHFN